jgi:carbonic anhydrase/acetyltransferase-like protein (isoleucine patch superfamily)
MSRPSVWLRMRHTLGRAFRETGQALDRAGVRGAQHAVTTRVIGDDPYIFDDHLSRHRHQMPLLKRGKPVVSPDAAFLAPCSTLIGSVRIGPGASIWYGAVLRADFCENGMSFTQDENEQSAPWTLDKDRAEREKFDESRGIGGGIYIGKDSNVQDGCILTAKVDHAIVGEGVTIGHLAQIHSATVEDHCLIGMGSMILEGAVVKSEAFIAAGAVVPPNMTVPSGELWVGNPARKLRDLSTEERAKLHYQADEVSLRMS